MTWLSNEAVDRLRDVATRPELPGDRYAILRPLGDRAGHQPPPPPRRRVGPGDDGGHLVPPGGDQGVQSGNGDLGGTCEDELHGRESASRANA